MTRPPIISVDLSDPEAEIPLKQISYLGRLYISVTENDFEQALHFIERECVRSDVYCNVSSSLNVEQVISLLNAGSFRIIVSNSLLEDVLAHGSLPPQYVNRLILSVEGRTSIEELSNIVESYSLAIKRGLGLFGGSDIVTTILSKLKDFHLKDQFYILCDPQASSQCTELIRDGFIPIIVARSLTVEPEEQSGRLPIYRLITDLLQSDRPDGLYPTMVCDERGLALGLVYSNDESIRTAVKTGRGAYYSRSRKGLWIKGEESGNTQELVRVSVDCDSDALQFRVRQKGEGFCHLQTSTCFGPSDGISRLEQTLQERKLSAPEGSYTARLFNDKKLLQAKIMEEASELCEAEEPKHVAAEAADLLYFTLSKCITAGISFRDVEANLDQKSLKVSRRTGDAKPQWAKKVGLTNATNGPIIGGNNTTPDRPDGNTLKEAASVPKAMEDPTGLVNGRIQMRRYRTADAAHHVVQDALQRPSQRSTDDIMNIVKPIIKEVQTGGDAAVLKYTHQFEKATSLTSPVLKAPFPQSLMQLPPETIEAIDVSYENIRKFHHAQKEDKPLQVETMPGVVCSRFSRPIERVGLYVPGGTAVLPSTALMLGVPAMVAGCKTIVLASPPRSDGSITPEIVYVAHKIGAESIVLAGGAQAVAALAYGTESISKVDKVLGPGNQFVTAGKMVVSNDTTAGVSIDMPAGPSEVLVVADRTANPAFVASDLLSQAEHGVDSQVILIAVGLDEKGLGAIEDELHAQASALPRVDIVRGAIEHSVTLVVGDIEEAMRYSNQYAPEHLILQVEDAEKVLGTVENAGSVFVGPWTPESVGDYSAGVNHSLPTYGYAKQYSGVNLSSFTKHITSSNLTQEGLKNVSGAVMQLAKVEELEAHCRAVSIRMEHMT